MGLSPGRDRPAERRDPPGLAARRAAALAFAETLRLRASLDDRLALHLPGSDDPGLSRAIAVSSFRRLGTIRTALGALMARGLPREAWAEAVLVTGAAQILFLATPDHAAVDLAVRLVEEDSRTRHLKGLVNAVLRRLAGRREAILAEASAAAELPAWLAARWGRRFGPDRAAALSAAQLAGAPLDLTCRSDPEGWAERLGGTLLPTGSVRLGNRAAVRDLPGYEEGAWWVQDAAAALPARLLAVRPGERVLDLCAAPGGKTAQLAAAGARVTALDRSEARLGTLAENLRRLRLEAELVRADGTTWEAEPFDAILLDAPCTATGTIRRHPDIPWIRGDGDVAALAGLQRRLLDRAAALLRPGGRLVYCVCSLEEEEGENQAQRFLDDHPAFRQRPVEAAALGLSAAFVTPEGALRTAPDLWPPAPGEERGGLDGFFAVSLSHEGRP